MAPTADVSGAELLPAEQRAKTLGFADRPLGPARFGHVTSGDLYDAILDRRPYAVHGLVGFGANLNRIIGRREVDPVSGSVPHRAYLCQVERA